MIELILGIFAESLFFSVFMLKIKKLKGKRILYIFTMLLLCYILKLIFPYNLLYQFQYIFVNYFILKLFYKNKIKVTDIFLFAFASLIIIVTSAIGYLISLLTVQSLVVASIIARVLSFTFIFIFSSCIRNLYVKFINNWNRQPNLKIKSLTVRNISIVVFNIMLSIIGLILHNSQFFMDLGMR